MVISILTSNREIHVGGQTFAEEDFLALLRGQLSPAALANIAAAIASQMPSVTNAASQAVGAAIAAATPQVTADATASAVAALPAAVASAIAALPKVKAGTYAITTSDASAGVVTIPTGLTAITTALLQLYDAAGTLQFPALRYSLVGSSVVITRNGLIWAPAAGQKFNWIAVGT